MTASPKIVLFALVFAGLLIASAPGQQAATTATEPATITEARIGLSTAQAAHPGNSHEVGIALIYLSQQLRISKKNDTEALEDAKKGLAVIETADGKDSVYYAVALSNLAKVYLSQDQAHIARPMAEQALDLARLHPNELHELAQVADALDKVCLALHDSKCAVSAALEAVKAERASHNTDELYLASMLQDLANLQWRTQDAEGARASMMESLAIVERQTKTTGAMAVMESNAGDYFMYIHQVDEALLHARKSLAMSTTLYGEDSVQVAHAMWTIAYCSALSAHYPQAIEEFDKSMAIHLKWYGPTHTRTADLETGYARVLVAAGNTSKAIDLALHAHASRREFFSMAIRVLPEQQALTLDKFNHSSLNVALSILIAHPEIGASRVYQEEILSRALVAEEMAQREKSLNRTNDPEIARLIIELDKERSASLTAHEAVKTGLDSEKQQGEISTRMERIERELAERSQAFRATQRSRSVAVDDIRKQLPKDAVLVSYVAYNRVPLDKLLDESGPSSYLAFVMHPDSDKIHLYDLGDAKSINEFVSAARASADDEANDGGIGSAHNERSYREAASNLRTRIWDPLSKEFTGAKLVLIVPDGMLNLIPFASLPDGDGYLVEHAPVIHMLTSERDLVPQEAGEKKLGLLAIGSPAYQQAANKLPPSSLRGAQPSCTEFSKAVFRPLPASEQEVKEIGSQWQQWAADESLQLVTGEDATLATFLSDAAHNRVLHIATHAYLLDKSCGDGNPLLRSGLVFAGANQSHDSSILTAQQIASLDLDGVDWAVLSACNTGLGELHDGEGVVGLQRAFRVAGARSVVMALWPVGDKTTHRFMRELYAERLQRHASTADSVWNSARTLLLERRATGISTHPWYWAGIVGSGDWK